MSYAEEGTASASSDAACLKDITNRLTSGAKNPVRTPPGKWIDMVAVKDDRYYKLFTTDENVSGTCVDVWFKIVSNKKMLVCLLTEGNFGGSVGSRKAQNSGPRE
jgi:hypothetical protein